MNIYSLQQAGTLRSAYKTVLNALLCDRTKSVNEYIHIHVCDIYTYYVNSIH